jgi:hypothetical protein
MADMLTVTRIRQTQEERKAERGKPADACAHVITLAWDHPFALRPKEAGLQKISYVAIEKPVSAPI